MNMSNLKVNQLYKLGRLVGLKGDYGRASSVKNAGGVSLSENLQAAIRSHREAAGIDDASFEALVAEASRYGVADAATPAAGNNEALIAAISEALSRPPTAPVDLDAIRTMVDERIDALAPRTLVVECVEHRVEIDGKQHSEFERVLRIVNTRTAGRRLHVWLTGASGSGKSHLAHSVARASGLDYYTTGAVQTQFQLTGFVSPSGDIATLHTPFRLAFERGGVFCWDDVDASDARALCAFNEALSNGRYAFPDAVVTAHADFVCIASANTWGGGATQDYVGRNRIDAATLTRFVRVAVDYDHDLETSLAGEHRNWAAYVQAVRASVRALGLKILITPRHTLQGAALLEAGFPKSEVEAMTVYAGLDAATEAKVRAGAVL
jgi:hypothetical protein